jgi:hypothetical protein
MPAIVTANQLRTVLGVSVSLYSDSYLDEIINTSEDVILPMLVANVSGIDSYKLDKNEAYFHTVREHYFAVGQSVIVTGMPAPFTATFTVTKVEPQIFVAALVGTDVTTRPIVPNGKATLSGYSAAQIYASTPAIESAILAVSVEVFQSRVAAGGQIEGVDFTSSPYRMGRSLTNRVSTLLMPYLDAETVCQ